MIPMPYWREMPTTAFNDCSDWIAVLPLAATEQHGPHLPVGVDTFIAEGLVDRAAFMRPDNLPFTFLPVQEIGKSNEHINFPGTLTLDWEQAIKSWLQIGDSIARAGVRKLVLITSHGGNVAPMDIVARELRMKHAMIVVTTSWGRLGRWEDIYRLEQSPMIDIHAGQSETAPMLVHRPDLVHLDKAQDFPSAQSRMAARFGALGYHSSRANIAWLAQDLNPEGAVGNASAATPEQGQADIDATVDGFLKLMQEIHEMSPPSQEANDV